MKKYLMLGFLFLFIFSAYAAENPSKKFEKSGDLKYKNGDYAGAAADYTKAISVNPKSAYAYARRGLARMNIGEEGDEDFFKAIRLNPEYGKTRFLHGVKIFGADPDAAISEFSLEIKKKPDFAEAYLKRGDAKKIMKHDMAGALDDYNAAIKIRPKFVLAFISRAELQAGKGEYGGAMQDYTSVIWFCPGNYIAYFGRGKMNFLMGGHEAAIKDLDMAIKIRPKMTIAYYFRAQAKEALKRYPEAIADYKTAIKQQHPPSRTKLKELEARLKEKNIH